MRSLRARGVSTKSSFLPRWATVVSAALSLATLVAPVGVAGSATACNKSAVDALKLAKEAENIEREDAKAAEEKYKQAIGMDPANHQIYAKLAALYERQNNWQNAAETWGKAAAADPAHGTDDFAKYHFQRGYDLYKYAKTERDKSDPTSHADDFRKAIDPLNKALSKDPNLENAWYLLGQINNELDQEKDAVDAYNKALQTNPTDLAAYVELAALYLNNDAIKEGIDVVQAGEQMAPNVKFENDEAAAIGADNLYHLVILEANAIEMQVIQADLADPADPAAVARLKNAKIETLKKARSIPKGKDPARDAEYQLALAFFDQQKSAEACDALAKYLTTPAGKSAESQANHKDAEIRQQQNCKH